MARQVRGYDFNRSVVEFTMLNRSNVILCAISTAAMDYLEGRRDVRPDQRVDQFMRLREVIEERASRKFFEEKAQPIDPWYCGPTIFLDNRLIGSSHVRFGSLADMMPSNRDVRFTPESGHAMRRA